MPVTGITTDILTVGSRTEAAVRMEWSRVSPTSETLRETAVKDMQSLRLSDVTAVVNNALKEAGYTTRIRARGITTPVPDDVEILGYQLSPHGPGSVKFSAVIAMDFEVTHNVAITAIVFWGIVAIALTSPALAIGIKILNSDPEDVRVILEAIGESAKEATKPLAVGAAAVAIVVLFLLAR